MGVEDCRTRGGSAWEGEDGSQGVLALWLRSRPMQEDPEQPEGPAPSPRGTGYKVTRKRQAHSVQSQLTLPGVKALRITHLCLFPPYPSTHRKRVKLSSNFHAASEHKDNRELAASLATSV